jgi:hypothetical protein
MRLSRSLSLQRCKGHVGDGRAGNVDFRVHAITMRPINGRVWRDQNGRSTLPSCWLLPVFAFDTPWNKERDLFPVRKISPSDLNFWRDCRQGFGIVLSMQADGSFGRWPCRGRCGRPCIWVPIVPGDISTSARRIHKHRGLWHDCRTANRIAGLGNGPRTRSLLDTSTDTGC